MTELNLKDKLWESNFKEFFYIINYPTYEKCLCEMEMRYLFDKVPMEKYFFSHKYINPSRSPFIKEGIAVIFSGDSLEEVVQQITFNKLSYDDFKVCYVKLEEGNVNYDERLRSLKEIGFVINGQCKMHNPKVMLGVTKVNGKWFFGEYIRNDYKWHNHDNKPYSYSNSLGLKVSKAVVNIAVSNDLGCTLVDPCCGVGTVVIEALDLGINVKGYEINESIAENAKRNLEFFGFPNVITNGDMHNIDEKFDVAIVDIPYGLFTATTLKEQKDIINTARRIANRLVIVTSEHMDDYIKEAGFTIVDQCHVSKNQFKRYISLCN